MIIVRAPMRLTLGGGGTDLPSYYQQHGGFCLAAAIDKYVYISLHQTFEPGITLKYSEVERVKTAGEIKHPIFREALRDEDRPSFEITSHADIPAGTGLGSSSSFTVALLKAIDTFYGVESTHRTLAEVACEIEIDRLKQPIGKQDQYIASYGGIQTMDFEKDSSVDIRPLSISEETLHCLQDRLMLFFTGYTHYTEAMLITQDTRTKEGDKGMVDNLHATLEMGYEAKDAFEFDDLVRFARGLSAQWNLKKARNPLATNDHIDQLYDLGMANGALGGKLVGAGGGGFLLFYTEDKMRLRKAMSEAGLKEVRFRFDFEGAKVICQ